MPEGEGHPRAPEKEESAGRNPASQGSDYRTGQVVIRCSVSVVGLQRGVSPIGDKGCLERNSNGILLPFRLRSGYHLVYKEAFEVN